MEDEYAATEAQIPVFSLNNAAKKKIFKETISNWSKIAQLLPNFKQDGIILSQDEQDSVLLQMKSMMAKTSPIQQQFETSKTSEKRLPPKLPDKPAPALPASVRKTLIPPPTNQQVPQRLSSPEFKIKRSSNTPEWMIALAIRNKQQELALKGRNLYKPQWRSLTETDVITKNIVKERLKRFEELRIKHEKEKEAIQKIKNRASKGKTLKSAH